MIPLRILIAEDEAVIAMLIGEVLAGLGHHVCATVSSADELVAAALMYQPELIIADAGLHDSSGLMAIATILKVDAVPHIFMSGNAAAVRASCPDAIVLEKPFDEADLEQAIAAAVAMLTSQ